MSIKESRTRNISVVIREKSSQLVRLKGESKYTFIFLTFITLFGTLIRFYIINKPIGYDEAYTFINFSSKPFMFILADYHAPNNHILNSLMIGIVYRLLGPHYWIVRVPALIASVLCIPAAYVTGRRFFTISQSLAASAILAFIPAFVHDAANGRGYPFVLLFSLLLANFAGEIVKGTPSRSILAAYAVTGALGFYSIPIFLYPMAGISLWVLATVILRESSTSEKRSLIREFLLTCVLCGLLTLFLYSPVIVFGTGLKSLVANDIVKSQTWTEFTENLRVRSILTWNDWIGFNTSPIKYISIGCSILSLLFFRKISGQKLPMQAFLFLGAGAMLVLQRVAPLPRIWEYLEMFLLFYAAAAFIWVLRLPIKSFADTQLSEKILSILVLTYTIYAFTVITVDTFDPASIADRTIAPEQLAAEYLAGIITDDDTIIAPAPVDIQTAYYMKMLGIPYETFQQRGETLQKKNAYVILRSRGEGKIKTMDQLLYAFKLEDALNLNAGRIVFEYGPLTIQSIPARQDAVIQ